MTSIYSFTNAAWDQANRQYISAYGSLQYYYEFADLDTNTIDKQIPVPENYVDYLVYDDVHKRLLCVPDSGTYIDVIDTNTGVRTPLCKGVPVRSMSGFALSKTGDVIYMTGDEIIAYDLTTCSLRARKAYPYYNSMLAVL
eukprot:TRINITY_DN2247_c0_g1_i2.p2 TRINITY_DN2247_c0_g1~~TRINITY_DN2247_c0_g1_i2.p2  ORF type:complete len:141 (-),score=30.95 TRINITY_DN2247_c0_g1_i2:129-551(-)